MALAWAQEHLVSQTIEPPGLALSCLAALARRLHLFAQPEASGIGAVRPRGTQPFAGDPRPGARRAGSPPPLRGGRKLVDPSPAGRGSRMPAARRSARRAAQTSFLSTLRSAMERAHRIAHIAHRSRRDRPPAAGDRAGSLGIRSEPLPAIGIPGEAARPARGGGRSRDIAAPERPADAAPLDERGRQEHPYRYRLTSDADRRQSCLRSVIVRSRVPVRSPPQRSSGSS